MFKLKGKIEVKNAIMIGALCSISYLAVYFARNILSAVSPSMVEGGSFTTENIGSLSSAFFIAYAVGQLINGAIGDKIKAKYMISFGLIFASICNMVFSIFSDYFTASYISYSLTGFFLSMIYGPMTKVVAENTTPIYATRCSLGYTFASFFGSPLAGMIAVFLVWEKVFFTSSVILFIMGAICFTVFTLFEKKKIVQYKRLDNNVKSKSSIKLLFEKKIVKFTFISIITGVIRTTVVFWLPTYISQYLGFSSESSAMLFTISTLIISFTPFIAIFVYEKLGYNLERTILLAFTFSSVLFALVFFVKLPILNIIFLILAIMSSNSAASMLWSRYCPSLRDTGKVSGVTGFLDFVSYMAASISSTLFANAVSDVGWSGLIIIWLSLMIFGVIISLRYKKPLLKI